MTDTARSLRLAVGGRTQEIPGISVIADATLYHLDDLALGIKARGGAPPARAADGATWIAALYAAEGEAGLRRLEGDFAFVIWDARAARLIAYRDFAGRRPLFHAYTGGTLHLGSTVAALLADPRLPRDFDLAAIATVAAGLWGHAPQTAYRVIHELPAGHILRWTPGSAPEIGRFWEPPQEMPIRRRPLDDAADELRELLLRAVDERVPEGSVAAVTLSGGWDSTAVYGAARELLRRGDARDRTLRSVSISYPVGDPGREDELITSVTSHWGDRPDFIDVDSIPLHGDALGEAAARDLPFAHTYERWNRKLFRRARELGATVVLDGAGGDQLFQASDAFLVDLIGSGQWMEASRQIWPRRAQGWRQLWRGVKHPAYRMGRGAPIWFDARFLRQHGVLERDASFAPSLPRSPATLGELHAFLRFPFFSRVFSAIDGFARDEGVASRSPLFDERIVRFAGRRPWSDRVDGRETKLVLRRAMRGLLPDALLAPRTHRTGITSAYFLRQLRGAARLVFDPLLEDPLLASIGMIDPARLRQAWAHVLTHDDGELAVRIWFTMQAELWMRTHTGRGSA